VLILLGTLCSQSTVLATAVMALGRFTILFAGRDQRLPRRGGFAALLTFIISVNIPAPLSTGSRSPGGLGPRLRGGESRR